MKFLRYLLLFIMCLAANFRQAAFAIDFNMAPLEFSNRAACALLSSKPTRSVFVFIDAFNAGKAGHARGLQSKTDPAALSKEATKLFRIWTTQLAVEIADKITKGELPLLPVDENGRWPQYFAATKTCLNNKKQLSCPAMNDFLSDVWARSHMPRPGWGDLGITQELDFFPKSINPSIGCHIVKKFSAFHSHLGTQGIDHGVLTNIGVDSMTPEQSLDSCFAYDKNDTDSRFTTVQLDMADISNEKEWDKVGYRFWQTFKLFFSWGWRYAPEYQKEFGEFRQAFASLAFEDSVMLVPNGCRTVEKPQCNDQGLGVDAMRAARFLGQTHAAVMEVPAKPIDILFQGVVRNVNNDELELLKSENADAWYRDFKGKLSGVRSEMINKLTTGMTKLQIITYLLKQEQLSGDIKQLLEQPKLDANEIYLACMEFNLAKNDLFDDIHQEIRNIGNSNELDSLLKVNISKAVPDYIKYYEALTETMSSFCKTLEARGVLINKKPDIFKSLNRWAYFIMRPKERDAYDYQCTKTPDNISCPENLSKRYLVSANTHPAMGSGSDSGSGSGLSTVPNDIVICKTPLECARTVLDSLVSVISVRRYAQAFLPLKDTIQNPDLFNTYSMPVACKLYDPWLKQRNAWKLFLADLGSSVLYGLTCGAFSVRLVRPAGSSVLSFRELYQNNTVEYDPRMTRERAQVEFASNLGFLFGIPCSVSLGNYVGGRDLNYYNGLSIGSCYNHGDTTYQIDPNGSRPDISNEHSRAYKACFKCGFDPLSVTSFACQSNWVTRVIGVGVGIFQGVLRLVSNLRDPNDIPRMTPANINEISAIFENNGKIPKFCHFNMKHGFSCRKSRSRNP
ncbi:MAG: hypothetical protein A2X86_21395 [Bdellovibrionales bacterium GWA2_49_15]|nr:MAG: hypothetical protein A2X86_21395 [Bdellovibrionales bacterium GWA2_49_15]HAZ14935.1 hypothetical protein [Bdellovibrionales bacterium]